MASIAIEIDELVELYSNAVGRYGPDSPEALAIRRKYADSEEFREFADSIDRIKRALRGSGIDTKATDVESQSPVPTERT